MEVAEAACSASFCSITTTPEAASERTGRVRFDLSYEYVDLDTPYSGEDESDGVQTAMFVDGDIESVHRELRTINQRTNVRASIGVTGRVTLGLFLPFVHRQHDHIAFEQDGAGQGTFDFSGVGDVTMEGRYALLASLNPGKSTFAIGVGVKLPTGSSEKSGKHFEDGKLEMESAERSIQPGSGSWDPIFSAYYLQRIGFFTGFANATIRLATGDEGYSFGNETLVNLGGSASVSERLEALAQVNARFTGRDESEEEFELFEQNTGGDYLFLSPGLRLNLGRSIAAYTFVQIPLYRYVNGNQLTADWSVTVGLNYSFAAW